MNPSPDTLSPARSRRRLALGALVLALVVGAGGVFWYRGHRAPVPPEAGLTSADPDIASAVREAREAVLRAPRSGRAWGRLGMVLRAHDYAPEAITCFQEAARLEPREPRWPYLHGLSLVLTDADTALPLLRRAAELAGDEPAPRLRLAEVLLNRGQLDEAEALFRQALDAAPQHPRALLGLGQVLAQRGQVPESLTCLKNAAAQAPYVRSIPALLAELYHQQGDEAAAAREARRLAALPEEVGWPDPYVEEVERLRVGLEARIALAGQLLGQRRPGEAVALLEEAVASHPASGPARHALGRALVRLGRLAPAEEALREAARLDASSAEVWFDLGVCQHQQGRTADAANSYRQALKANPSHAVARYNLGLCEKAQGDMTAAEASWRDALRYQPAYAPAHRALGELLLGQQRVAEAVPHLETAVRLDPDDDASRKLLNAARGKTPAPSP